MSITQDNEKWMTACGGVIKNPEEFPSALYQGKRVFFCNQACRRAFEAAPDAFMKGEIEHPKEEA